jgi:F0F1-type ATP synthase assembly protein I
LNARGPTPEGREKLRALRTVGFYTMIPMLFVAGPAVGYLLGLLLVRWFGAGEWAKVVMVGLGFVAAVREIIAILKRAAREDDAGGR